jgi:hypothetical protein
MSLVHCRCWRQQQHTHCPHHPAASAAAALQLQDTATLVHAQADQQQHHWSLMLLPLVLLLDPAGP